MNKTILEKRSMEEIGLDSRDAWRFMWVAYTVNSLIGLIGSLTIVPALQEPVIRIAILVGFATAPIWFICERKRVAEKWVHIPFWLAAAIYLYIAVEVGDLRANMAVIMYSAALTTAAMHPPRFAAPHIAFAFIAVGWLVLTSDDEHAVLRTLTAASVFGLMVAFNLFNHNVLTGLVATRKKLAETDPLTGLPNVRRLRSAIGDRLPGAGIDGRRVALFALDLDNFKQVNDEFSHSVGDEMLRAVAAAARAPLGPGDFIARRGGDEFAIVVHDSGERDLTRLADEIRCNIREARRKCCPEIPASASIGCVTARHGDSVDDLLARADAELHEAKLEAHPERRDSGVTAFTSDRSAIAGAPNRNSLYRKGVDSTQLHHGAVATLRRQNFSQVIAKQRFTAAALVIAGLLPLGGAAFGIQELGDRVTVALASLTLLTGIALVLRVRHGIRVPEIVVFSVIGAVAFVFVLNRSGSAGVAMLELLLLPVMFVVFAGLRGKLRVALLMIGVGLPSLALFYYFLDAGGYPHMIDRIYAVAMFLVGDAMVVGQEEARIRKFSETNAELAASDSLTGVANLHRLHDRLATDCLRAEASGKPFAVVMIDLDSFKQVNDTYSHTVGDHVLKASAAAIVQTARAGDLVARRGGDEFMVVTTATAPDELNALATRIADSIEQARMQQCPDLPATASYGTAVWSPGDLPEDLLRRADEAAHESKARNRRESDSLHMAQAALHVGPREVL